MDYLNEARVVVEYPDNRHSWLRPKQVLAFRRTGIKTVTELRCLAALDQAKMGGLLEYILSHEESFRR